MRSIQILTQLPYSVAVLQDLEISRSIEHLVRRANANRRLLQPHYGVPAGIVDRSASVSPDAAVEHIISTSLTSSSGNPLRLPRFYLIDESVYKKAKDEIHAQCKSFTSASGTEHPQKNLEVRLRKHYTSATSRFSNNTKDNDNYTAAPRLGKGPLGIPRRETNSLCSGSVIRGADGTELLLLPAKSLDDGIDLIEGCKHGHP